MRLFRTTLFAEAISRTVDEVDESTTRQSIGSEATALTVVMKNKGAKHSTVRINVIVGLK